MHTFGTKASSQTWATWEGSFLEVIGFNELGEVVGQGRLPDALTFHASVAKKGKMIDLGSQDGNPCSYAIHINDREQVVGFSDDCSGNNSRALLWENGQIIDLNALVTHSAGLTLTTGISINDRAEITAQGVLANGDQRAVVLIPCDPEHPSVDGCDYSIVDVTGQPPATRTAMRQTSVTPSAPMLWRRNHRFRGTALGSSN
jgi:probable HAF family extracellular repeat protein